MLLGAFRFRAAALNCPELLSVALQSGAGPAAWTGVPKIREASYVAAEGPSSVERACDAGAETVYISGTGNGGDIDTVAAEQSYA